MLTSPVLAFLPEIIVLAAALLTLLLDVIGVRRLELLGAISVLGTTVALLLVVADLGWAPLAAVRTLRPGDLDAGSFGLYAFRSLGLDFQAIFLLTAFLVSLASISRPSHERGAAVFFGLLLIATLGMLLATLAAELIFLLLAIEVTGISTYLMVGYTRRDPRGLEAAMKFYIIGAASTAISFFGASLLFVAYGTTAFAGLGAAAGRLGYPDVALAGYALLLVGLGFKVTAVPFHMWAVDVYDGAPTDVSAFLAGGSKKLGVFAFFLVFLAPLSLVPSVAGTSVGSVGPTIALALGILAVLTMTVGNVLALRQREMKRMLAYSSISQAGYMLIGIAVGSSAALAGATLQVFAHVFMKTGAFLLVAGVTSLGVGPLIEDWKGVGTQRPYLSAAFALMLLGLAGIPLTVGFVSKFVLFSSAVQAKGYFVWLAIAGLLNSALSVFYYARVLKVMYMDRREPTTESSIAASGVLVSPIGNGLGVGGFGRARAAAILLATIAILAFGIDPQPVLSAFQSAAQHFVTLAA